MAGGKRLQGTRKIGKKIFFWQSRKQLKNENAHNVELEMTRTPTTIQAEPNAVSEEESEGGDAESRVGQAR
jgi:hypothetical protein